jgi:SAM-dependent methyltransferase
LQRLGYKVSALDIPEFQKSASLGAVYEENGIDFAGVNLRHYKLPYESGSFDAVILCEVIEHLNFNPLPILMEINRVLKPGGYIYIGMPNQSSYANRRKLLFGHSVHNPIDDFFAQLDRKTNMIVGLHWREYTVPETVSMIEKMGFETCRKYYYGKTFEGRNFIAVGLKRLLPFLLPSQVVIGRKVSVPNYDFWLTEANS